MSVDIILKHSSQAGKEPDPGDLKAGELAVNTKDVKAYIKNADGAVVQIAGGGSGADDNRYVKLAGDDTAQEITGTGGLNTVGVLSTGGGLSITGGDVFNSGFYENPPVGAATSSIVACQTKCDFYGQDITNAVNYTVVKPSNVTGNRLTITGYQIDSSFGGDYKDGAREAYGFRSNMPEADNDKSFSFYGSGTAPSFSKGSFYVGGSTATTTLGIWQSTLSEEQLEQFQQNQLTPPANVTSPGNGEYVRQWYYDQQDDETKALLLSGELSYPTPLVAETFVDSFALGDNTAINLLTGGTIEAVNYKGGGSINSATDGGVTVEGRGVVQVNRTADQVFIGRKNGSVTSEIYSEGGSRFTDVTRAEGGVLVRNGSSANANLYGNGNYMEVGGNSRTVATFSINPNTVGNGTKFGHSTMQLSTTEPNLNNVKVEYSNGGHAGQILANVNSSVEVNTAAAQVRLFQADSGAQQSGKMYGFFSGLTNNDSTDIAYNYFSSANAPNYFNGSTYIGGTPSRNTFELWKSTLTEEQVEQFKEGLLAIPETVSDPDNGFFARHWYYNQQDEETQALLDSGELEYPTGLSPATFSDSFSLGTLTNVNILSTGIIEVANKYTAGDYTATTDGGVSLEARGVLQVNRTADQVFIGRLKGDVTSQIFADGGATFNGNGIVRGDFKAEGNTHGFGGNGDGRSVVVISGAPEGGSTNEASLRINPSFNEADSGGLRAANQAIIVMAPPADGFVAGTENYCIMTALGGETDNPPENSFGFFADQSIGETGTEANYGFYGDLVRSDDSEHFNLYMGGNAPNFFEGEIQCRIYSNKNPKTNASSIAGVTAVTNNYDYDVSNNICFVASSPQNMTTARQSVVGYQVNSDLNSGFKDANRSAYAFKSNIAAGGNNQSFAFYGEGNAPSYALGGWRIGADPSLDDVINSPEAGIVIRPEGHILSNTTTNPNAVSGFRRNSDGDLIRFYNDSTTIAGSLRVDAQVVSLSNTSDYRLKSDIKPLGAFSEKVKALKPCTFTLNGVANTVGFIAHELQEVAPECVFGEKDGTEAIGTVTDYDGTVLETDVVKPFDLTYTEMVVSEQQPTIEGEEPKMVETTRTKTWKATGERPVYQKVDQTKLIPHLVKALQEALERIEALEAAAAG